MQELTRRLRAAQSVTVLTGAGISAESGLPTFRGIGGLWRTHRVDELASPSGFARDPHLVWTWYNERKAVHRAAQPNAGHRALAELELLVPDFTLATQNVDSLHQRAGLRNVLELHGHLREARCNTCNARRSMQQGLPLEEMQHECGGLFRPDIVWFGEGLDQEIWTRATQAAARSEVMLVIGTSGIVNPAALLATHFAGEAFVAEINPEETAITGSCHFAIRQPASVALPNLLDSLRRE